MFLQEKDEGVKSSYLTSRFRECGWKEGRRGVEVVSKVGLRRRRRRDGGVRGGGGGIVLQPRGYHQRWIWLATASAAAVLDKINTVRTNPPEHPPSLAMPLRLRGKSELEVVRGGCRCRVITTLKTRVALAHPPHLTPFLCNLVLRPNRCCSR